MFETRAAFNPCAHGTTSTANIGSAGGGISGGYTGSSFTIVVLIILFPVLSIYNSIELLVLISFTFNKYKGVYFWSLLISSLAIIPYSLGFLLKFGNIIEGNARWLGVVLLTPGWWGMVTGQSVVLWSRLHLMLEGEKGRRMLQWTGWMIAIDAIILHIPTTILTFGSNGTTHTDTFVKGYNIMEKIQMSGFFVQEVILSSIYIVATVRILKTSIRDNTKKLMWQLMGINIIIIFMDMALLGLEAASLYLLETLLKGVIYSVKLKLEFAILGRLVQFVGRPGTSIVNDERTRKASLAYFGTDGNDKSRDTLPTSSEVSGFGPGFVSDFTELARFRTQTTHVSAGGKTSNAPDGTAIPNKQRTRGDSVRLPPGKTLDDVNVAMFQHSEEAALSGADLDDAIAPDFVPLRVNMETQAYVDRAV